MVSGINSSDTLLSSYKLGMTGTKADKGTLKTNIKGMNPIQAFACLASYFAGQEENKMSKKLTEYEKAFEAYKECLKHSKEAHQGKASAAAKGKNETTESTTDFNNYMNDITDGKFSKNKTDAKKNRKAYDDQWDKDYKEANKNNNFILGPIKPYKYAPPSDKASSMDKGADGKHSKDEWQSFADVLNQEKDMRSTDLNKLSTEMDMAVKDSSEAEQMAANAIKKAVDLMSTQGKTSGG
ncbi:MAG: hypothetical protein RBR67_07270 [Desulfobacterium sp.]|nr:hypothetical protein [Desulfobacterium sp.]